MSEELVDTPTPSNGAAPTVPSTGNQSDDEQSGKKYSFEEVQVLLDKKARGLGKELAKVRENLLALEKERDERSRKELEEQGKFKEINQKLVGELEELRAWKQSRMEQEAKELEELSEKNEERLKKLPEPLRKLIHPSLDARAKSQQLTELESMVQQRELKIHGGAGDWQRPTDSASALDQAAKKGAAWIRGKK